MQTVERWVTRSDAWTPEDDERLAGLVLEHIRSGSTQLRAFEEAANLLGRTNAACGYRWNGVVRKHYQLEIEAAKRDRKTKAKQAQTVSEPETSGPVSASSSESMHGVIQFLETYDHQYQALRAEVESLSAERKRLTDRVQELEAHVNALPNLQNATMTPEQLAEDSKTLFAIMERARRLLEMDSTGS